MSSIKKNFIYNLFLNISRIIFPLITAPYVSRVLEPDGIGTYHFAATYAGYFALVALLGIPTYGVREVAKFRNEQAKLNLLISQLLTVVIIATLIVDVIYIVSLLAIHQLRTDFILFFLSGFCIYLAPFQTTWFYQGIEKFDFITIRTLVVKSLSIISLFIFVRDKNDLIIYVIISALGTILADVWNFWFMRREGVKITLTLEGLKKHLKPILLLFASSVAISIYTILDTLMLGFMTDYSEVGYYSNAIMISKMFLTIVTSLSVVAIPRFINYIHEKDFQSANILVNKSFSFTGLLSFPIAIGMFCVAAKGIPWFFGDKYYAAIIPLKILSVLNILIGFSNILGGQILVGMEKEKEFLICILLGAASNFIMNCILIPSYGATGAAVSTVIAEFLVTSSMLYFVYKLTPIRINVKTDLLKSVIGSSSFLLLLSVFPSYDNGIVYLLSFTIVAITVYSVSQLLMRHKLALDLVQSAKEYILKKQ